ncbi:conserved Plasmodium protein, unknown function [Plasmodium relictum]|uniref:Uncharacterized protein n=1 Tax=Plasmodium relictum TaxID=85471 RepID=A0A1J1H1D0_PLARL|nr:conserved Plasmodium protein, unknown function [Plasmodium relictum]CRG98382.1 conserved Plasmodium protein, unknown function [Plasmodium relictum]
MHSLLNKCFKLNGTDNSVDEEESIFESCKIIKTLNKGIDGMNYVKKNKIGNDYFCGYDKNNSLEEMKTIDFNEIKTEDSNLNAYYENNFNKVFNIEYINFPNYFYKTIFLNFFSSFIELEDKESISSEYIEEMNKICNAMKNQKYILLHKANSIPHQKKSSNINYKNGDALICSDNIIAVADGVSSINNSGINVSNFSNEILKKCLNLHIYRCINNEIFENQNKMIFKQYNLKYKNDEILKPIVCRSACSANFLGASTLLFSALEKEKLHICSIGDCQMLIVRLKGNYLKDKGIEKIHIKVNTPEEILYFVKDEKSLVTKNNNCDIKNVHENNNNNVMNNEKVNIIDYKREENTTNDIVNCEVSYDNFPNKKSYNSIENDSTFKNNKDILNDLYSKRKELYYNDFLSDLNIKESIKEDSEIILYIEDQLSEDISENFEKYLSKRSYKIGNLSFKIEEDDFYDNSNIRSDTLISHNCSSTRDDFSENEKKNFSVKSTLDNIGYRNLLNLFNLDRTHIIKNKNNCSEKETEEEKVIEKEKENHVESGKQKQENKDDSKEDDREKEKNDQLEELGKEKNQSEKEEKQKDELEQEKEEKKKKKKDTNINNFNDYRFRFYNDEISKFDIIFKSKIQQHYFNCPYQITFMPINLNDNLRNTKSNNSFKGNIKMSRYNDIITKCLRYCEYSSVNIENNDIIISGSDGLFDNLYDDDIMEIIFNNFYVLKYNKFVSMKQFINFYKEYKKAIKDFNKTLSNNFSKRNHSKKNFSSNLSDSFDRNINNNSREKVKIKMESDIKHGISNVSCTSSDNFSKNYINEENNNNNNNKNNNNNNNYNYDNKGVNLSNKENKNNYFFNNIYKRNLNYAKNKLKFPSKIKGKFFIRIKNKVQNITKSNSKQNNKVEKKNKYSISQDSKNSNTKKDDDTIFQKEYSNNINSSINNLSKNFMKSSTVDINRRNYSIHSGGMENSKYENLYENLENDNNSQSDLSDSNNYDLNFNNSNKLLENEKRQTTIEQLIDDDVVSLRKKKKNSGKWLDEENTFSEFLDENIMNNNVYTNREDNSYYMNEIRRIKKKKKVIVEKKIDCSKFLYELSDFILIDKDNKIYLNTKKACDEILELSTILANQQLNYTLLKKRRIKYNGKMKNNSNNNNIYSKKVNIEMDKKDNEKNFNEDSFSFSNVQDKEIHLFDKVNYEDIQSNKSNDKIILTPISEFIFDKYKKYFNMGKPDDTTVIVSVVKENRYNV